MKDKWVKLSTVKDVLMRYSPPESKHAKYFSEFLVERINEEAPAINAIIIPKGLTNGDVIRVVFPNYDIECDSNIRSLFQSLDDFYESEAWSWWNAPYKQEEQG